MTRTQIRLDTLTDVNKFIAAMTNLNEKVWLEDGEGCRTSATSLLGVLYSLEWKSIFCYCEKDISGHLIPWTI